MSRQKGKWSVLIVLSMAAFIMVIDSTAMNVSISNLVADLNTDIGTIQTIMSIYTLTMAVFMLPGAKVADIFGKKKVFLLGVAMYGVGTLTAALAVNTAMLFVGWAIIEGLASSLMMPTALSLITSAYEGKARAVAMSIYVAMSSVALAVGPLFGGLITTYLSWRFVFALEVLIVAFILIRHKTILGIECPQGDRSQKFDIPGTILSMLSLLSIISGALLSSTYGWFEAKEPFNIFGLKIKNVSITFILLCTGAVFLALLICWLVHAKKKNKPVLIDITVFKSRLYDFVLVINLFVQICLMGTMFVVSIYLQNVLKYNAFATGLTLMPLSLMLFVTAFIAVKVTQKIPARFVVSFGALCVFIGALYMYYMLSDGDMVSGIQMIPAMIALGIGIGCTLSLTSNIALSDIDQCYSNQGSGMITTVNNFGSSMSTSVIGSLFTSGIAGGILSAFISKQSKYPDWFSSLTREQAAEKLQQGFEKVKVMNVTIDDIPAEKAEALNEIVIAGVNNSMMPIFIIIMSLAILASLIAAFLLKPKKKS
ncbi:MAG: MFS transporter [Ruminococcus sp.]|nr:MFS transporter [Ruminococcus sp.]